MIYARSTKQSNVTLSATEAAKEILWFRLLFTDIEI